MLFQFEGLFILALQTAEKISLFIYFRRKGYEFRIMACLCWTTYFYSSCWKSCCLFSTKPQLQHLCIKILIAFQSIQIFILSWFACFIMLNYIPSAT